MAEAGQFLVLEPEDPRWDALFDTLPLEAQDVFYSSSFARLCRTILHPAETPVCATYSANDGSVLLYPFVVRNVANVAGMPVAGSLRDTVSLYGRGGVVGRASAMALDAFHASLAQYMSTHQALCSFDRFHPVMGNHALAAKSCKVIDVGGFVVVNLRQTQEALKASFKGSVRTDMRKAQRNGVTCFAESNCDHLADFLEIYYQTMDRNAASGFYYFPEAFFGGLPDHIPGKFHYFYAMHQDRIVSCELVLHHGIYAHSFINGTRRESLPLAANPLLKDLMFRKAQELGCQHMLLGGGQRPNDSLFFFKKAYAPDGVLPSLVGGTIWRQEDYETLRRDMAQAGREVPQNRFQFYDQQ